MDSICFEVIDVLNIVSLILRYWIITTKYISIENIMLLRELILTYYIINILYQ